MWAGETEKPAVAWSAIWILMLLPLLVSLYQNFGIATIELPERVVFVIPAHGCKLSNGEL